MGTNVSQWKWPVWARALLWVSALLNAINLFDLVHDQRIIIAVSGAAVVINLVMFAEALVHWRGKLVASGYFFLLALSLVLLYLSFLM